jgi:hypothetical protein
VSTTHPGEKPEDHAKTPAPDTHGLPDNHGRTEHEERIHRHKDELLDQGVEETFPASDPVAVKHIT